jgi:hypothetical protein
MVGGQEPAAAGGGGSEASGGGIAIDAWLGIAYVLVLVAAAGAWLLATKDEVAIGVSEGFAPFAVIYVVAQAIERVLQPFAGITGKAEQKTKATQALATAQLASAQLSAQGAGADAAIRQQQQAVAATKGLLREIKAHRALIFWAWATILALLVCGVLELGLIQTIAHVTGTGADEKVPSWFVGLDVVITGIAIGSGTKPLHDTITFIQASKEKAEGGAAASSGG